MFNDYNDIYSVYGQINQLMSVDMRVYNPLEVLFILSITCLSL